MVLNDELVGKSVMTTYNRRIYRIDRVDFQKTPADKFQKEDGTEVSFAEYYLKNYKKKISDLNQALLLHVEKKKNGVDKEIYLIPELCVMTGLTDR